MDDPRRGQRKKHRHPLGTESSTTSRRSIGAITTDARCAESLMPQLGQAHRVPGCQSRRTQPNAVERTAPGRSCR